MKLIALAVFVASLGGASSQASGATSALQVLVSCSASSGTNSQAACPYAPQQTTSPVRTTRLSAQDEAMDPATGALNSASATAYASYGALGVGTESNGSSSRLAGMPATTAAGSYARATAMFGDTMMVNAPGLANTSGLLTVQLKIDGDLHAWDHSPVVDRSNEGFQAYLESNMSFWDASVGGLLLQRRFIAGAAVSAPGEAHSPDVPTTLTLQVPIIFGHKVYFETSLLVWTEAVVRLPQLSPDDPLYGFPRVGGANASFMHTLTWEGVASLTDAQGQAVTSYSLSSATGIDWRSAVIAGPVPEPSTAALSMVGAALLGWRLRRARAMGSHC